MKFGGSIFFGLASAVMVLSAPQHAVKAADLPGTMQVEMTTESGLSVTAVPFYMWLPGMNGTVGVFGATAEVDVTPIDLIENLGDLLDALDGIYMGTGELRYGDFGFLYDVVYLELSSINDIERGRISGNVDLGFSQVMATLAGSYRAFETERGYLDALAGLRIWDINMDLGINLNVAALHASDGDSWVDPIVGGKGRFNLTENVYASGWAMIGGFGAGSDFMWDVWGNFGYEVNDWFDAFAGIRAVGADRQSGTFIWDLTQYGPVIGATIKLN